MSLLLREWSVVTACGGLAAQSQGLGNARNSLRLAGRLLIAVCTDEHRSINRLEDCLWLSSYPAVVNATRSPWYNPQSREVRVRSVVKRILALLRRDDVYKAYTSAICVTGVVHFPVKYI